MLMIGSKPSVVGCDLYGVYCRKCYNLIFTDMTRLIFQP